MERPSREWAAGSIRAWARTRSGEGVRGRRQPRVPSALGLLHVLRQHPLPIEFASLDEENFDPFRAGAIGDQRRADRPKQNALVAREVVAAVPET